MNRQWKKRARGSAPESLKSKPEKIVKQSDNRLSVRLSNRLLFGYRSLKASRTSPLLQNWRMSYAHLNL
ncbi:hypothetical protein FQ192_02765 [Pseudomonas sp. ANT_J12]|nr:hypothetical protein FQ192_02765 [Pseudomonas sp. ANT_J12]